MTDKAEEAQEPKFESVDDVLHHIQKNVVVPKGRHNKFGNYYYRSAEDIVDAVKAIMPENAYLTLNDNITHVDGRFYIVATARLSFKGKSIETTALAREESEKKGMDAAQLTGATSSYARKYALNGLFAIDDSVDADSTNTHGKEEKKPKEDNGDALWVENTIKSYKAAISNEKLLEVATLGKPRLEEIKSRDPVLAQMVLDTFKEKRDSFGIKGKSL